MKNVRQLTAGLCAAAGLFLFCSAAQADELTANYDEYLLNGDAVLNGGVLNGAWQTSFASSVLSG